MVLPITGAILALYTFARKIKNEPYKSELDSFFDKTNKKISISIREKPTLLFNRLLELSNKGLMYSLLIAFIIILLPKQIEFHLIKLIAPVFIITALLSLSIPWIQNHKRTFKETFLNIPMIGILFFPLLVYLLNFYLKIENLNLLFNPLQGIIDRLNILYVQLIWSTILISFVYLGNSLIAFTTYIPLYVIIATLFFIIRKLEKIVDIHILDALLVFIASIVVCLEMFLS